MTALTVSVGIVILLCLAGSIACRWAARRIDRDFGEGHTGIGAADRETITRINQR